MKTSATIALTLLAVIIAGLLVTPTLAESLDTEILLIASDGAEEDQLGQAVAISGNVAIIGADRDDDHGANSGSAYLFDATTGNQLFKLTASDGMKSDAFGHSVAIDGNLALIGAISDDDEIAGHNAGSAYLFDVTTGNQLMKLTASDAGQLDQFGHGVAISGNRMVIGSYLNDDAGANSGSAYIFDTSTGEELYKLTASDAAEGDWFGYWIAIQGNIAVVGARRDDDGGFNSGSAYVFDVTTGEELFKLTASDAGAIAEFGYSAAIDGDRVVIGAFGASDKGYKTGSAYVFDLTTGKELYKLSASDGERGDEFGYAVGISGNLVVVGAFGDDDVGDASGSAYVYDLTFGDEVLKLNASDATTRDEFGTAVGISGNVVVSGAWLNDANGTNVGQAYLIDISAELPPGADFNSDGTVDTADLARWESSFPSPRLDIDGDNRVDGSDFLLWQQSFQAEVLFVDSRANLDQQGPVGSRDIDIWQQSFGVDGLGDVDNDGDTDGADFLALQRDITPFDFADENLDRLVDGFELDLWRTTFGWDAGIDGDGRLDGDADGDGIVSGRDFRWWQIHFTREATSTASVSVPEPASSLLISELLLAYLFVYRRAKRHFPKAELKF